MVCAGAVAAAIADDNCIHHGEVCPPTLTANHALPDLPGQALSATPSCINPQTTLSSCKKRHHASSFYIDCGFFGAGKVATRHGKDAALEHEKEVMRLHQFHELTGHTTDQRLADPPFEVLITPSNELAMHMCLQDKKCTAVCRSELGSTTLHSGKLDAGFGDVDTTQKREMGPWLCMAKRDMEPLGATATTHLEKCWQDMYDASGGLWNDKLIVKLFAPPPSRTSLYLDDSPLEKESLEETKTRCEQSADCEAICVHEKDPWRGIMYGGFDDAKSAFGLQDKDRTGHKHAPRQGAVQESATLYSALEVSSTGPLGKQKSKVRHHSQLREQNQPRHSEWHLRRHHRQRSKPGEAQEAIQRRMDRHLLNRGAIAASSFEQVPRIGVRLPTADTGLLFTPPMLPRPWPVPKPALSLEFSWFAPDAYKERYMKNIWKCPAHRPDAAVLGTSLKCPAHRPEAGKEIMPALMAVSFLHKVKTGFFWFGDTEEVEFKEGQPDTNPGDDDGRRAQHDILGKACPEGYQEIKEEATCRQIAIQSHANFAEESRSMSPRYPRGCYKVPHDRALMVMFNKTEEGEKGAANRIAVPICEKAKAQSRFAFASELMAGAKSLAFKAAQSAVALAGVKYDASYCPGIPGKTTGLNARMLWTGREGKMGKCVLCESSPFQDTPMHNSKDGQFKNLKRVFWMPDEEEGAKIAADQESCRKFSQQFACGCVDDNDNAPQMSDRWGETRDKIKRDKHQTRETMLKDCSNRCREYALQTALEADAPKFRRMTLDDAVVFGFKILGPPEQEEDHALNRAFFEKVLTPAKKHSDWLDILYPGDKPQDGPHPGEDPLMAEMNPYGEMGPDGKSDEPMNVMPDKPNDYDGWECYYLSPSCRKQAQNAAAAQLDKFKEEIQQEQQDLEEFEKALESNPKAVDQGFGLRDAADFWAKDATPESAQMPDGSFTRRPQKGEPPAVGREIKRWWNQCIELDQHIAKATSQKQIFTGEWWSDARVAECPPKEKTIVKEASGRWLECCGGLGPDEDEKATGGTLEVEPAASMDTNVYEKGLPYNAGQPAHCEHDLVHITEKGRCYSGAKMFLGEHVTIEDSEISSDAIPKGCFVESDELPTERPGEEPQKVLRVVFQDDEGGIRPHVRQFCTSEKLDDIKYGKPVAPFECPPDTIKADPELFEALCKEFQVPFKKGNHGIIYPEGCYFVSKPSHQGGGDLGQDVIDYGFCNRGIPGGKQKPAVYPICAKPAEPWWGRWFGMNVNQGGTHLASTPMCRPLHEEPVANCESCPDVGTVPDITAYKCLGRGWNGMPPGEFSPSRSFLTPVEPRGMPSDQQQLEVARATAKPKEIGERNKHPSDGPGSPAASHQLKHRQGPSDLRCVYVGQPGQLGTKDAARVLYAAAEMPPAALVGAALSPDLSAPPGAHRPDREKACHADRSIRRHWQQRIEMRRVVQGEKRVHRIVSVRVGAQHFL